jgi:hypothetical protein
MWSLCTRISHASWKGVREQFLFGLFIHARTIVAHKQLSTSKSKEKTTYFRSTKLKVPQRFQSVTESLKDNV